MTDVSRRDFIKLAGAGTAVVAGGALTTLRLLDSKGNADTVAFRAVAGLPHEPLPAYASYVLEGQVDLAAGTGTVRRTILAGSPEAMSAVVFHELTREMRVTGVRGTVDRFTLRAVIEGAISAGEARESTIVVDRAAQQVQAPFVGQDVLLQLQI